MTDNSKRNLRSDKDRVSVSNTEKDGSKVDEGNKKLKDLAYATEVVNKNYGHEYEKLVNDIIRNSLNANRQIYFKANIKSDKLAESGRFNKHWKLFKKKKETQDDNSLRQGKKPKQNEDSLDPFQLNIPKIFGTIQSIELDGAAYIRKSTEKGKDVTIEIEDQTLTFEAPCLILIETTVMSDKRKVLEKLIQLLKDYVYAKTEPFILDNLICDENGFQSEEQLAEATKANIDLGQEKINVYLLCVTNFIKEEGQKSYEFAWNIINELFKLSKLSAIFDTKNQNSLDGEDFKNRHVKHIYIKHSPYLEFVANAEDFHQTIKNLDKDVNEMKEQMNQMDQKMNQMEEMMNQNSKRMEHKMNKIEGEISGIQYQLTTIMAFMEKIESQMKEGKGKKED